MLKFGGFKASFNLLTGKKSKKDQYEKPGDLPVLGAYRGYGEDYFGNNNHHNKPLAPSAKAKPSESARGIKTSKSTNDLTRQNDRTKDTKKSTSDLPSDLAIRNSKEIKSSKEMRKPEKSTEHKKRAKSTTRDKTEKEVKTEKNEANQKLKTEENKKREKPPRVIAQEPRRETNDSHQRAHKEVKQKREKKIAPQPPQIPLTYSSGTLESSISRSSGLPPYTEVMVPNQADDTGNTSFGKPVETPSSWDLVSQHRQQLRTPSSSIITKTTVLDLGYHTRASKLEDSAA